MTMPDDSMSDSDELNPLPVSRDSGDRPRVLRSEELLQGAREVWIEHGSEMYRLRLTSAGKLYLTK